jgi:hypothetical protein
MNIIVIVKELQLRKQGKSGCRQQGTYRLHTHLINHFLSSAKIFSSVLTANTKFWVFSQRQLFISLQAE